MQKFQTEITETSPIGKNLLQDHDFTVKEADSANERDSHHSQGSYTPSTDSIEMVRTEFKDALRDLEERMKAGEFATFAEKIDKIEEDKKNF